MESTIQEVLVLLSVSQVVEKLGICRRTLEREIQRGRFPAPLKIGKSSRWSSNDVACYLRRLDEERLSKNAVAEKEQAWRNDMARLVREKTRIIERAAAFEREQQAIAAERARYDELMRKYQGNRGPKDPLPLP